MPVVDFGSRELPVHVSGCGFVGEAVTGAGGHLIHAPVHRGQKDDVVQMADSSLGREVGKKPWPDHSVVHGVVATGDEAAGGSRRGPYDHLVLAVSRRQPGGNGVPSQEPKEGIARDEHAPVKFVGQCSRNR